MKNILRLSIFLVVLFLTSKTFAGVVTTVSDGCWLHEHVWSSHFPTETDTVILQHDVYIGEEIGYDASILDFTVAALEIKSGAVLRPYQEKQGLATVFLTVNGQVNNLGAVTCNAPDGDVECLVITVGGNFSNSGTWEPYKTILTGSNMNIELVDGATFGGYRWEGTANTVANLQSDFVFTGQWALSGQPNLYNQIDLGQGEINASGYEVNVPSLIINGTINNATLFNTTIEGLAINGNTFVKGWVESKGGVVFEDNLTVSDTLLAFDKSTAVENITNNGVITTYDIPGWGYGSWHVMVSGDIVNNGVWAPRTSEFIGDRDMEISQASDVEFGSPFTCSKTAGSITAASDLYFASTIDLDTAELDMQNNQLHFTGKDVEGLKYNVSGVFNGKLRNVRLYGGFLDNVILNEISTIYGTVKYTTNTLFNGNLIVMDTLQTYFNGYQLNVSGNVTNKGIISKAKTAMDIFIQGNLVNEGVITDNAFDHGLRTMKVEGDFLNEGAIDLYADYNVCCNGNMSNAGTFQVPHGNSSVTCYSSIYNYNIWDVAKTTVILTGRQFLELENTGTFQTGLYFSDTSTSDSYQWYYQDSILISSDFRNENTATLMWDNSVVPEWYGTYYCNEYAQSERNITVGDGTTSVKKTEGNLDIQVWNNKNEIIIDYRECKQGVAALYNVKG